MKRFFGIGLVGFTFTLKALCVTALSSPQQMTDKQNSNIHTLLLVRHGDSIWNGKAPGCRETFTGWSDVPLSSIGVMEAKKTAEELSSRFPYAIDACFTSILQRARETSHYCCWAYYSDKQHKYIEDYRLNERHYGSLQGFVKSDVEDGNYGHDYDQVIRWRRSWTEIPPLLDDNDPRRIKELKSFANFCGGHENVPKGESLEMVAKQRIKPFLHDTLYPILESSDNSNPTGLVVAHANSLRALIGVICNVEKSEKALKRLEAMKIKTGVPLILKYRKLDDDTFQPIGFGEGLENILSSDFPVYYLSSIPLKFLNEYRHDHKNSNIDLECRETKGSRRRMSEIRIDVI